MKIRAKIVPDNEPNAEGEWIDVEWPHARRPTLREIYPLAPEGFHIVMTCWQGDTEPDLKGAKYI